MSAAYKLRSLFIYLQSKNKKQLFKINGKLFLSTAGFDSKEVTKMEDGGAGDERNTMARTKIGRQLRRWRDTG